MDSPVKLPVAREMPGNAPPYTDRAGEEPCWGGVIRPIPVGRVWACITLQLTEPVIRVRRSIFGGATAAMRTLLPSALCLMIIARTARRRRLEMMRRLKPYGLGARFFAFVLITMIGSLLIGGVAAGFASYLMTGEPALMLFVPLASVVGGGFAIPVALVLWLVPSGLIFSASMGLLEEQVGTKKAARWSGSITALAAAIVTTYVAADFGRDFDGAGLLMLFVGPTAVQSRLGPPTKHTVWHDSKKDEEDLPFASQIP